MKDKIYLSSRKWLNPIGGCDSGAIQYSVHSSYGYVESNMDIWDCSKKVGLTFSFEDERGAKVRLNKINGIINALEEMKSAMGKAYPDIFDKEIDDE
jgi:hypothetical protein